jgi:hypothetical protein
MNDNIEIKHIHSNVGVYNGSLCFAVDDRLLFVEVGTPHFNDFNEWRISEFRLSSDKYIPEENDVVLTPYEDFDSIFINEKDLEYLTTSSKIFNYKYEATDEETKAFEEEFGEFDEELAGVLYKDFDDLHIYNKETDSEIYYLDWANDENENKTIHEKIFYPIINNYMKGYRKLHYSK